MEAGSLLGESKQSLFFFRSQLSSIYISPFHIFSLFS